MQSQGPGPSAPWHSTSGPLLTRCPRPAGHATTGIREELGQSQLRSGNAVMARAGSSTSDMATPRAPALVTVARPTLQLHLAASPTKKSVLGHRHVGNGGGNVGSNIASETQATPTKRCNVSKPSTYIPFLHIFRSAPVMRARFATQHQFRSGRAPHRILKPVCASELGSVQPRSKAPGQCPQLCIPHGLLPSPMVWVPPSHSVFFGSGCMLGGGVFVDGHESKTHGL